MKRREVMCKVGLQRPKLMKEIEICRDAMVKLASETSLSHPHVIAVSKKLDVLLYQYHTLDY
ncbi:aspartyl-phosphate phosphatase Spo0E family protein [Neobacillus sp. PS2-9]|uniref:aspartyl-phosphate phosphatase Spo0E family protein n=1 Tax=Neobacillus sp. PS2-9 TaxID=3070676 RepID=UPI0027DF67DD|nr:aspartyl-phosphate phosphatase Spo0E family protein [Neobacillus sp. PS2-9]WML58120.1 aspartyl-phosphate phosphatase Spo0E family protein [Neobacillus sp. PS2-9]